jgi:hypothetical protein
MTAKKKNMPKRECAYVPRHARKVAGRKYWLNQSTSAAQPASTAAAIAALLARGKKPRATASDASP